MATQTKLVTGEELFEMSTAYHHYELVGGELIEQVPNNRRHGRAVSNLGRLLGDYAEEHDLGEIYVGGVGFYLARDCRYMEAVSFWPNGPVSFSPGQRPGARRRGCQAERA